ncbi:MAG: PAS domain S-box protein [Desulfobacterales bacterium]|nr:PAS domain S-box protein [Desulfobacterales bacterium]
MGTTDRKKCADRMLTLENRIRELETDLTRAREEASGFRMKASKFEAVLNHSPMSIVIVDRDARLTGTSRHAERMAGDFTGQLMGQRFGEFLRCIHHLDSPGGCGKGPACGQCSIRQAVRKTFETGTARTEEAVWFAFLGDRAPKQLRIISAPVHTGEKDRVILFIEDITHKKQTERLMKAQRDLGTTLGMADNLNGAMETCLKAAMQITGFDCGGIYLVSPDTGDLTLAVHENLPGAFIEAAGFFPSDSPQAGFIRKGIPFHRSLEELMEAIPMTAEQKEMRRSFGWLSVSVIPVMHGSRAIAALNLASTKKRAASEHDRYALETMASQIGGRLDRIRIEQALEVSRRNFYSLFESLDDLLFVVDPSGKILTHNQVVETCLGYSSDELAEMNLLDLHPHSMQGDAAIVFKDMLEGKTTCCSIPVQTRDGSLIPVETKVALGSWDGRKAVFGIARDTIEIKRSEASLQKALKEKESLLREIHHRVKNNLQVVSSLLCLQSRKVYDKKTADIFHKTETRVRAMALVHEILYQSDDFSDIRLQHYLERLLDHLVLIYAGGATLPDIKIRTGDVILNTEQAIPCGLVVTELVTNSLKYAVPAGPRLSISICAHTEREGELAMTVADNGRCPPEDLDPAGAATLGLSLVTGLIREQLEGRFKLDLENGVCWHIRWPRTIRRRDDSI